MKVREENADLINFYLEQGHTLTKTQRHSFGEGKKSLWSVFPMFPYKNGKKILHVHIIILFSDFPMLQSHSLYVLFGQSCLTGSEAPEGRPMRAWSATPPTGREH